MLPGYEAGRSQALVKSRGRGKAQTCTTFHGEELETVKHTIH